MPTKGFSQQQARLDALKRALTTTLPKQIAANAERHFKNSFRLQGWLDGSLKPWVKTKGGKPGRVLKKTGLLMNSIRIARADAGGIQIVAGGPHVPYARIHNEGGTIEGTFQVRGHARRAHRTSRRARNGRKIEMTRLAGRVRSHDRKVLTYMAKRKYMGNSKTLDIQMRKTVLAGIYKATGR